MGTLSLRVSTVGASDVALEDWSSAPVLERLSLLGVSFSLVEMADLSGLCI